ncbi:MAG: nuclear transport factor 2 family protein [Bacteroidota bacterium]
MRFVFYFLSFFISVPAIAQDPKDDIKQVITQLFKGMQESDSASVASVFMDGAIMQTIVSTKENKTIIKNELVNNFASSVGRQKKGSLNEIIEFDDIKIDPPLAFVWTPYRFYFNGSFSHSGVNAFCLVKSLDGWRIQYIIDTRKR